MIVKSFFMNDVQNGDDCNGHGTHCSGTIGGASYGLAKNVRLYNARVFPCSGGSSTDTIIAGKNVDGWKCLILYSWIKLRTHDTLVQLLENLLRVHQEI